MNVAASSSYLVFSWYFVVVIKTMHNQCFTKTKQNRSNALFLKKNKTKKVQDSRTWRFVRLWPIIVFKRKKYDGKYIYK